MADGLDDAVCQRVWCAAWNRRIQLLATPCWALNGAQYLHVSHLPYLRIVIMVQ